MQDLTQASRVFLIRLITVRSKKVGSAHQLVHLAYEHFLHIRFVTYLQTLTLSLTTSMRPIFWSLFGSLSVEVWNEVDVIDDRHRAYD